MSGWYLMHRGWMRSGDFRPEPFTDREAYQWSIEQAAFEPHRQWFNGTLYMVGRGEFITSLHAMGAAFQWSDKRVRGFTQRMVKAGKWAKQGAHAGAKAPTRLVVLNYDEFQRPPREWGEAKGIAKGERGAKQGRREGEEQKERLNNSNEFQTRDEERGLAPRAPAQPVSKAWNAWKEIAKLKGWIKGDPKLSPPRSAGLSKILKEHGWGGWIEALQRAADSELLGGHDPPGWFNSDFVTTPTKFLKLYEGNYDKQFSGSGRQQQRDAFLEARDRLSADSL